MKKIVISILCTSIILIFAACNDSDNKTDKSINNAEQSKTLKDDSENYSSETKDNAGIIQADDNKNNANDKKDTFSDENNKKSINPAKTANHKQTEENRNNYLQKKKDSVNRKINLYEGMYFDDKCFGENSLIDYCEIEISNVTDTSFDFTVYKVNASNQKEDRKIIFLKNTAVFMRSGTEAAFYGNDYNLSFTFPDNHLAYPIVTDIQVSGFKPLEGGTYVNNRIPGHEFG